MKQPVPRVTPIPLSETEEHFCVMGTSINSGGTCVVAAVTFPGSSA